MDKPAQGPRTAVCTIVSKNYLHFARTLMESLAPVHPDWDQVVLLVDEFGDGVLPHGHPFRLIDLSHLDLPAPKQFCFRYTILELNTAVKPWLLGRLLDEGYERVVYLDPDIRVVAPLTEVARALDEGAMMVLTPHVTEPMNDALFPGEKELLQTGCFNLGFIALSKGAVTKQFLSWWQKHLEHECRVDLDNGLFVDQKWLDLAPGLYEAIKILMHPGYNVAYWNLAQRPVARVGDQYQVRDKPLVFFHFSGLNPEYPTIFSKHQNRFSFHNLGEVSALVLDYCGRLKANGFAEYRRLPYAFGQFADGRPITDRMRRAYRQSPQVVKDLGEDPFITGSSYFPELDPQASQGGGVVRRGLKRGLRKIAKVLPRGMKTYLRSRIYQLLLWAGGRKVSPHTTLSRKAQGRAQDLLPGLNIIGYVRSEHGVGESARLCAASSFAAQVPFTLVDFTEGNPNRRKDFSWEHKISGGNPYRINLFHVNAEQMPVAYQQLKPGFFCQRYNIGFWHWELPEFPQEWVRHFALVDEVWAPSQFVRDAVAAKAPVPVLRMPHAIQFAIEPQARRADFGLPEGKFLFLAMYDTQSIQQRKNPQGAIDAFRQAFPDGEEVCLVLKVNNAHLCPEEVDRLKESLRGVNNILLVDRILTRQEVYNLEALCDGFISLHRSEGYGLGLAECMFLGKPVVGTNWSGNVDFMNVKNSCPVDYQLAPLARDYGPYKKGQTWAEPDLDHAAWCLRKLVEDGAWRRGLATAGRHTMLHDFSPTVIGRRYQQRLEVLDRRLAEMVTARSA